MFSATIGGIIILSLGQNLVHATSIDGNAAQTSAPNTIRCELLKTYLDGEGLGVITAEYSDEKTYLKKWQCGKTSKIVGHCEIPKADQIVISCGPKLDYILWQSLSTLYMAVWEDGTVSGNAIEIPNADAIRTMWVAQTGDVWVRALRDGHDSLLQLRQNSQFKSVDMVIDLALPSGWGGREVEMAFNEDAVVVWQVMERVRPMNFPEAGEDELNAAEASVVRMREWKVGQLSDWVNVAFGNMPEILPSPNYEAIWILEWKDNRGGSNILYQIKRSYPGVWAAFPCLGRKITVNAIKDKSIISMLGDDKGEILYYVVDGTKTGESASARFDSIVRDWTVAITNDGAATIVALCESGLRTTLIQPISH